MERAGGLGGLEAEHFYLGVKHGTAGVNKSVPPRP